MFFFLFVYLFVCFGGGMGIVAIKVLFESHQSEWLVWGNNPINLIGWFGEIKGKVCLLTDLIIGLFPCQSHEAPPTYGRVLIVPYVLYFFLLLKY